MKSAHIAFVALAALALSFFGGAGEAKAADPTGHQFCPGGMSGPSELAGRMSRSLAADPSGNTKLEKCHATPYHFLIAFQKLDPGAKLTHVSQLPTYIRKLVVTPSEEKVEYFSACLHDRPNGARDVVLNCVSRELRSSENRYANPDTGVVVLLQSCVNPGGSQNTLVVETPCIEVRFPSMGEKTPVRFAYMGRAALPGRCHKYMLAGESRPLYETPEECPDTYQKVVAGRVVTVVCRWDEVEVAVSEKLGYTAEVQNVSGSFYTRAVGTNSWFLPPEALDGESVICWEAKDGTTVTVGVRREDFVNGVAVITKEHVYAAVQ